ncbi:hypothetical protein MJM83_32635, partial [Salmonella enterica subsp. enterica serovar Montevideo]|nr:hypothetical protein [Salmonella enterica subsp. enterica serovar Montevideo]
YTIADPRHQVIKRVAKQLSEEGGSLKMYHIADRLETVMWETKSASLRFLRIENILSPCIKEKVTSISPANNKRIIVRNCDDIRL